LNFSPKFDDWRDWATGEGKDGEPKVLPEIVSFLQFDHDKWFHNLDPDAQSAIGGEEPNTLWPSPRKWEDASSAIMKANKIRERKGRPRLNKKEMSNLVSRSVGKTAASAFLGFLGMLEKIDPRDVENIWTNPDKGPDFSKLDVAERRAILATAVFKKGKSMPTVEEVKNFFKYLERIDDGPMAIAGAHMLGALHPALKSREGTKDAQNYMKCIESLFKNYPELMDPDR
jgi:hypothetical protein